VTRCVTDPCAGVTCGENSVCVDGQCKVAPCADVVCDKSQICLTGTCIANPCERITCPTNFHCVAGQCLTLAESTTALLATGSGGCACRVDRGPPPLGWWLVALFWLGAHCRRRGRGGGR
jgi:MYXO-CTERM domain-containing protein